MDFLSCCFQHSSLHCCVGFVVFSYWKGSYVYVSFQQICETQRGSRAIWRISVSSLVVFLHILFLTKGMSLYTSEVTLMKESLGKRDFSYVVECLSFQIERERNQTHQEIIYPDVESACSPRHRRERTHYDLWLCFLTFCFSPGLHSWSVFSLVVCFTGQKLLSHNHFLSLWRDGL